MEVYIGGKGRAKMSRWIGMRILPTGLPRGNHSRLKSRDRCRSNTGLVRAILLQAPNGDPKVALNRFWNDVKERLTWGQGCPAVACIDCRQIKSLGRAGAQPCWRAFAPMTSASVSRPTSSLMLSPANCMVGWTRPCFCWTTCQASWGKCCSWPGPTWMSVPWA